MARVLLVDDEEHVRKILAMALARAGHVVLQADRGSLAIAAVFETAVDVIVLDLCLPDFDGRLVFEAARLRQSRVPVIVITGFGSPEVVGKLRRDGAFAVLAKPLEMRQLVETVARALQTAPAAGSSDDDATPTAAGSARTAMAAPARTKAASSPLPFTMRPHLIRIRDDEWASARETARRLGLSASSYLRHLIRRDRAAGTKAGPGNASS